MRLLVPILIILITLAVPASPMAAQENCTNDFVTRINVCGDILAFWQTNGGLSVFGNPISPLQKLNRFPGDQAYGQWFERARLEISNKPWPYNVELGLLGLSDFAACSVENGHAACSFQREPEGTPHYFGETGYAVAEVFWADWISGQLNLGEIDTDPTHRALALTGFPISPPLFVKGEDGVYRVTQYFERAVLEFHEEFDPPLVLRRRLGAKVLSGQLY